MTSRNISAQEKHEQQMGIFGGTIGPQDTVEGSLLKRGGPMYLNRQRFRKEFHQTMKQPMRGKQNNFINIHGISNYEYVLNHNTPDVLTPLSLAQHHRSASQKLTLLNYDPYNQFENAN